MATSSQPHTNAGTAGPIVRAQIEAVAAHPSARIEDQAAARRWLAGTDGTHAEVYPHLAWTPAIEQRCREQCARAFQALLGLAVTSAPRKVDRCSRCGTLVEPDAAVPCCSGARIVPDTARSAADVLGLQPVTAETLSAAQVEQVLAALTDVPVHALTSRQRVLLAACERLAPDADGMTEATCQALRLDELGAVAEMSLEACAALVAGAWNSAVMSLQAAA